MSVVMSVKHDVTWDDQVAPIQPLRLAVSVVAAIALHCSKPRLLVGSNVSVGQACCVWFCSGYVAVLSL
jgi:hypothetical protein